MIRTQSHFFLSFLSPFIFHERIITDEFDEFGVLDGLVPESMNPVSVIRLSLKMSSENWVIISEVQCKALGLAFF